MSTYYLLFRRIKLRSLEDVYAKVKVKQRVNEGIKEKKIRC